MKIRNGFVSNSSSASFVIQLNDLTARQLQSIINHSTIGAEMGLDWADSDYWNITVGKDQVCGDTFMDNFDMHEFFERIGVPESVVRWDDQWER